MSEPVYQTAIFWEISVEMRIVELARATKHTHSDPHDMYMHCLYSLFCQLPNYNLFTQHVIYLYGETPLVNCGPRSILFHCYYRLLSTSIIYFLAN
jgi:hypothetical protein